MQILTGIQRDRAIESAQYDMDLKKSAKPVLRKLE